MASFEFVCPRCGATRPVVVTSEEIDEVRKQPFRYCMTCGGFFRLNVDTRTNELSVRLPEDIIEVPVYSPLLNEHLNYTEPTISNETWDRLTAIIKQLKTADKTSKPSTFK